MFYYNMTDIYLTDKIIIYTMENIMIKMFVIENLINDKNWHKKLS